MTGVQELSFLHEDFYAIFSQLKFSRKKTVDEFVRSITRAARKICECN